MLKILQIQKFAQHYVVARSFQLLCMFAANPSAYILCILDFPEAEFSSSHLNLFFVRRTQ